MPRYIKDGAYTIVIDDVTTSKDSKEKSGKSKKKVDEQGQEILHTHDDVEDEESEEEEVSYADPKFVLQNLSITMPSYAEDKSNMLKAREELTEIVAYQIAFYTYCALQPLVNNSALPTILFFGDGYMGSRVLSLLNDMDCGPLLRVFSRGDIGARDWRDKGYISDSNLLALMKGQKPSIVIICSEYTSFQMLSHQLLDFQLLEENTCVIYSTLGFQRKKLFYNFGTPGIFRTFVEPQRLVQANRPVSLMDLMRGDDNLEAMNESTMSDGKKMVFDDEAGDDSEDESGNKLNLIPQHPIDHLPGVKEEPTLSSTLDSNTQSQTLTSTLDETAPIEESYPQRAAQLIFDRVKNMKNFLIIVENYYALHDMTHEEARRLALRTLVGYVDHNHEAQTKDKTTNNRRSRGRSDNSKRQQIHVKVLEKILLVMYSRVGIPFQAEFSKHFPVSDLIALLEDPLAFTPAQVPNSKKDLYIDKHGKHHFLRDSIKSNRIYDTSFIHSILALDDDYSNYQGPGFDLMARLDYKETPKVEGGMSLLENPLMEQIFDLVDSKLKLEQEAELIQMKHAQQSRGPTPDRSSRPGTREKIISRSPSIDGTKGTKSSRSSADMSGTQLFKEFFSEISRKY